VKVKRPIEILESDGRVQVKVKGSHRQFKHPAKRGKVTVSGKLSIDMPPGTLRSVLRQAGINLTGQRALH